MKITASLNLTSDAIVLDTDPSAGTLVVQDREWGTFAPTLTRDEAASLRDELDRAIGEIDRKAGRPTRTSEPSEHPVWTEYAAWPDGFITDLDDIGRATLDASENEAIVRVWAFEPPKSYQHACDLAARATPTT